MTVFFGGLNTGGVGVFDVELWVEEVTEGADDLLSVLLLFTVGLGSARLARVGSGKVLEEPAA